MYDEAAVQRRVGTPASPGRTPFQRDRARVLHSRALRTLAGKTQVVEPGGLHSAVPRTRLTHSLECAQIGRELGAALGCDPDLVDAACLAHDLGHPPFGHNGETALDEAADDCGGFEGNAQSFRLLTRLEPKVAGAGLDLTRATLDAATKYPWPRAAEGPRRRKYGVYDDDLEAFTWARASAPEGRRCLESQVMDWADDVAYSVHDLEDGIATGLVEHAAVERDAAAVVALAAQHYSDAAPAALETALARLLADPRWPRAFDGGLEDAAGLKELTSALIGRFCDAAETATRAAHGDGPLTRYAADLRVPEDVRAECAVLKAVTAVWVMRRPGVLEAQDRERALLRALVGVLRADPAPLGPPVVRAHAQAEGEPARTRVVLDAVAALPDAAAVALWTGLGAPADA